jgi:hypothetical protein
MKPARPKLALFRRFVFGGQLIGCILVFGLGLTSDRSGLPFIVAGLCVLASSFVLWLYCRRVERKTSTVQHSNDNAA